MAMATQPKRATIVLRSLEGLQPLDLQELHENQQLKQKGCVDMKGRVFYGVLVGDARQATGVAPDAATTKVQQCGQKACTLLGISNALTSYDDPKELVPDGAAVAIKEPRVALSSDRELVLLVPCLASIEFFFTTAEEPKLSEQEAQEMRLKGNRAFIGGRYLLAAQHYGQCIDRLDVFGDEYVLACSNRAECFLRLKRYDQAIVDCNKALQVKPEDPKSLFRKGMALMAMQEHKQALLCLKAAQAHSPGRLASDRTEEQLLRCSKLLEQSETGVYDISDFILGGCKEACAPEFSDYVGPVEMRMTPDGRGRGLFVTRDVKLGELLIVNNAAVLVNNHLRSDAQLWRDFVVETLRICATSTRVLQQIYSLPYAHGLVQEIPDMAFFRSSTGQQWSSSAVGLALDLGRIEEVLHLASFGSLLLLQRASTKSAAVWALPAFINHSCLPNVSKLDVGSATLFRAARNLNAGDQLLFSYVECLAAGSYRTQRCFDCWKFYCHCPRCLLEEKHKKQLEQIQWPDLLAEDRKRVVVECGQAVIKLENLLAAIPDLSEVKKDWIRASYPDAYGLLSFPRNAALVQHLGGKFLPIDRLMELLHETAPGHFKTTMKMAQLFDRAAGSPRAAELLAEQLKAVYGEQRSDVQSRALALHADCEFLSQTFGCKLKLVTR